ncbi:MAG: enoyl-CoA hydratase-related protein, partial [Deltaproteobacteria bacterium]|nr:enoyl-CoA hydratase-related protein [Deltaproteobacteria bacterium]
MSTGEIFQLTKENGIGIVTFNMVNEPMNTWTEEAIVSFTGCISALEKDSSIKGAILISGKPNNFLAGANLKIIAEFNSEEGIMRALNALHAPFNRLSALPFPTIAAINGHCLGGGLELSLACTARIARESETTLIGLPECKVGIFPAAGGTQRLPRLIGYGAIELILRGIDEAKKFLAEIVAGKADLKRPVQDFSQLDDIIEMARQGVLKATKGREIPGPMMALKSMQDGLKVSLKEGLEFEKKYFVIAGLSKEAK